MSKVRYEKTKHAGIRKRIWLASGEVTYQIRWETPVGRRSATRDTLREAVDLLDEMKHQRRQGGSADPRASRVTYGQNWERWHPTKQIQPSTRDTELSYYRNHIEPCWSHVRVNEIDPFAVEAWLMKLKSVLPEGATRRKIYRIFGQPIRQLVRRGVLLSDPLLDVEPPAVEKKEARFLEPSEWQVLEDSIHPHWRLVIPYMLDTGLRIGEVGASRVLDLDLDQLSVRVRATASVDKGRRVEGPPKSAAGRRTVPLLTEAVATRLAAMIQERGLGPQDHLFTGPQGGLLTPSNWRNRIWHPAVLKAGIEPPATPHALRHTAISRWIAAGATAAQVKQFAGHSTITITYDRYGHLFPEDVASVRQRLQDGRG